MERDEAKKLIKERSNSEEMKVFLLSDLFYDGKFPNFKKLENVDSLEEFIGDSQNLLELIYNPLKRNIKRKTNYLLARPYTVLGNSEVREYIGSLEELLEETVKELYKKGEAWWEIEPILTGLKFKLTLRRAETIVPRYTNQEKTAYDAIGYLWNKADGDRFLRYVDFVDATDRYRISLDSDSAVEQLGHAIKKDGKVVFSRLPFIKLTSDSLYSLVKYLGVMYSNRYQQADTLLEDNADPVGVIKNASETDPEILREDIKRHKLVRVDGTGDFGYASKTSEYSSIESFMKMVKSDMNDLMGVVSREQELTYVTSGRAFDRLYVDMDADAVDMGKVLRQAIRSFLSFVSEHSGGKNLEKGFDIIFNTDKPTDEGQIISNIRQSEGLLSKETLLAQHPWVEDVEDELKKIEEEKKKQPAPITFAPTIDTNNPEENGEPLEEEG